MSSSSSDTETPLLDKTGESFLEDAEKDPKKSAKKGKIVTSGEKILRIAFFKPSPCLARRVKRALSRIPKNQI